MRTLLAGRSNDRALWRSEGVKYERQDAENSLLALRQLRLKESRAARAIDSRRESRRYRSPFLFFFLVSIGRNASGRATPTAEHDYVLTCIPAIARYPLRNTVPLFSPHPSGDIVNREYVLSRLIALRRPPPFAPLVPAKR